ncbi:MAG: acetate--CoA ligase family protein [Syntrophales bacterium]|nr:acetate--CoA ligase family protein [Syntrophales bacterium]
MNLFLNPASVAVIGVPRKTGPGTFNNVEMMLRYGYKGKIYPVNPNASHICGLKAYSSVDDIPESPDLAIISVSRDRVLSIVKQCAKKEIKRIIVITQGFADADDVGKSLQEELTQFAKTNGVRIMGPNTMGVLNNYDCFTSSFVDKPRPEKFAPVSLIAQSGVFQVASHEIFYGDIGKAIDIGNACDVDFVDALEYFGKDPQTEIICIHMEGIKRGKAFLELATDITKKKPIVVLKTGRTKYGGEMALSHSGSLVGEDHVFDAAFRRAGIIRVKTMDDLKTAVHALLFLKEMKGPRVAVITVTGAGGIIFADAAEEQGLIASKLPEGLAEKLTQGLPDWLHVKNPIDIWPIGMIGKGFREAFSEALESLLTSDEADAIIGIFPVSNSPLHQDLKIVDVIDELRKKTKSDKPLAVWPYLDREYFVKDLEKIDRTACFESVEQAVLALNFALQATKNKTLKKPEVRTFPYDEEKVLKLKQKGKILVGDAAQELLSAFDIPTPESKTVYSIEEGQNVAAAIGYPVVLKVTGPEFLHKSEWGGVKTGIRNATELKRAFKRIESNVRKINAELSISSWQIQKHIVGKELLLGLKKDPQFGHVIACGLGGIYTEVFMDIARELTPIGRKEAEEMIKRLKIYPILRGVRGEKPVNIEMLIDILERLSFMAQVIPEIQEMDLNPVIVSEEKCVPVDARIIFE